MKSDFRQCALRMALGLSIALCAACKRPERSVAVREHPIGNTAVVTIVVIPPEAAPIARIRVGGVLLEGNEVTVYVGSRNDLFVTAPGFAPYSGVLIATRQMGMPVVLQPLR